MALVRIEVACFVPLGGRNDRYHVADASIQRLHDAESQSGFALEDKVPIVLDGSKWFREWRSLPTSEIGYLIRELLPVGRELEVHLRKNPVAGSRDAALHGRYTFELVSPGCRVHTRGFETLSNLLHHVLKHPCGLGVQSYQRSLEWQHWRGLLGVDPARQLERLERDGCPACRKFIDRKIHDEMECVCLSCMPSRRISCLGRIWELVDRYEEFAWSQMAMACDGARPRHAHLTHEGRRSLEAVSDTPMRIVLVGSSANGGSMAMATLHAPYPWERGHPGLWLERIRLRLEQKELAGGRCEWHAPEQWMKLP